MLGHSHFYHGSIRRYTAAFGSIFSDIHILRPDDTQIKVPLHYSAKSHMIQKVIQRVRDTDAAIKQRRTLPVGAFNITSIEYDASRQLQRHNKYVIARTGSNYTDVDSTFQFVPYNINFDVSFLTQSIDDNLQIIEQIIPFFCPKYSLPIKSNPLFVEEHNDVPVILNAVNYAQEYEGSFDENRRMITCDMSFTLKGVLYGPTGAGKLIRHSIVNQRDLDYQNELTNNISKFEVQIDPTDAKLGDPFDYVTTKTDYTDE